MAATFNRWEIKASYPGQGEILRGASSPVKVSYVIDLLQGYMVDEEAGHTTPHSQRAQGRFTTEQTELLGTPGEALILRFNDGSSAPIRITELVEGGGTFSPAQDHPSFIEVVRKAQA